MGAYQSWDLGKGDINLGATPDFPVIESNNPKIFRGLSYRCNYELPLQLPIIQCGTYVSGPQRAKNTDPSTSAKAQTKISAKASATAELNRKTLFPRPALVQGKIVLELIREPAKVSQAVKECEAGNDTASFELCIPEGILDLTFWIPAKPLPCGPESIQERIFLTRRKNNSPYLSVVFDDLYPDTRPFEKLDHGLYVRHRLAIYSTTALYNRHKFRANGARANAIRNAIVEPP